MAAPNSNQPLPGANQQPAAAQQRSSTPQVVRPAASSAAAQPAGAQRAPIAAPAATRPVGPAAPSPVPAPPAGQTPLRPTAAARPVAAPAGNAPIPAAARPIPVQPKTKPGELPVAKDKEEEAEPDIEQVVAKGAPPWLVSMVFHMLLLIIMGLWVVSQRENKNVELDAVFAERPGEQLLDDSVLFSGSEELEKAEEQIITPQNLPPVEDPFAAPPQIADLSIQGHTATSEQQAPEIGMALTGRTHGSMKNVLLAAYGGNATTEAAVLRGLQWLAKNQRSDGTWSLVGPYSDGGQEENVPAATAMALLAFQGNGNTHLKGEFAKNVAKGWAALLKLQDKDGDFARNVPSHQRLYAQGQCTIALCELYGMTNDSRYREPAERAIKYAVRIQDKQGGWRYTPGSESDTSVTGWFVMALQSARMAKLEVPPETLKRISDYLDAAQEEGGRVYAYQPSSFTTLAVTAEGLLCRQYLGWKQDDPRLIEGVKALNANRINYNGPDQDVYYWYYATQAAHHMENVNNQQIWRDWNEVMRQEVPEHQVRQGREAGSWEPGRDRWGSVGGRLYVTCLSIYMLEVYYRHLPIYSGYKFMPSN